MKIILIVEGKTEQIFIKHLRKYLESRRLSGCMPSLKSSPYHGHIPTEDKLKRVVHNHLTDSKDPADHVIALTDVYTGDNPPIFQNAMDAKNKMREWVGDEPRFHPHAAQYDFEAWLLPYWETIQKLAGHNKKAPSNKPEDVNHSNPPAYRIKDIFRIGTCRNDYVKTRDGNRILEKSDLDVAISQCPELKALINTILSICGAKVIP